MSKIENEEVREYLINDASSILNNCEEFIEVYGEDFAQLSLQKNLKKVYTDDVMTNNVIAFFSLDEDSITTYYKGSNGTKLKPNDIRNNSQRRFIMSHEAIHAIFKKSPDECKKLGILKSTGIYEQYNDGSHLGKAINEGITNWILDKSGINAFCAYDYMLNIIKQIELAIGTKNVMKLASGGINTNVANLLKMNKKECRKFLAKLDYLLILEETYNLLHIIIETLYKHENKEKFEEALHDKIEKDYNIIKSFKAYTNLEQDPDYFKFLSENSFENCIKSKIDYLRVLERQTKQNVTSSITDVESEIFNKYFKREFRKNMISHKIKDKSYNKFLELSKLMMQDENLREHPIEFQKEFEKMRIKYQGQKDRLVLPRRKNSYSRFISLLHKKHYTKSETTTEDTLKKTEQNDFVSSLKEDVDGNKVNVMYKPNFIKRSKENER